jgi:two-component system, cell cycle sensor histidine kinase and response regulator CckA
MLIDIPHLVFSILITTFTFVAIAVGYIVTLVYSKKKIIEEQQAKIEAVEKSEKRFRDLFENSLAGMMKFNFYSWHIDDSNSAMFDIFECKSAEELTECLRLLPEGSIKEIDANIQDSGSVFEYEIHTKTKLGKPLWVLFSAKRIGKEDFAQAVVIDITAWKESEEKIEEQAALLNETHDAILVTDMSGSVVFINKSAEYIYGWTKKDIIGRKLKELISNNGHAKDFDTAWFDAKEFGEWVGEQWQKKKNGKEILIDGHWRKVTNSSSGKTVVLMVNSDITEKKKLEANYIRSQKMESIALLTSGLAHDLQNILAPVAMSIELLKDEMKQPKTKKILRSIDESAHSGLQLVKNILSFGRSIKGEKTIIEIRSLLQNIIDRFMPVLPADISLDVEWKNGPLYVYADESQLRQVFVNLLVNAKDAIEGKGKITLSASDHQPNEHVLNEYEVSTSIPYVAVSVHDTGAGISEEMLPKIFEPFFTTKDGAQGTGLGLSIVDFIVRNHEGFTTVQSKVKKGTTFFVYLPKVEKDGEGN